MREILLFLSPLHLSHVPQPQVLPRPQFLLRPLFLFLFLPLSLVGLPNRRRRK